MSQPVQCEMMKETSLIHEVCCFKSLVLFNYVVRWVSALTERDCEVMDSNVKCIYNGQLVT